ncbi:MAG: hypothetical protein IKE61_06325 [Coriobacteriales bacterium]|nr:hypothetical protein [Coriobacteriales bacterium]
MTVNRIAYVCAPEQVALVEHTFEEFETKNAGLGSKTVDIYKDALRFKADLLIVFDCGLADEVIVELAKRAKVLSQTPEAASLTLPRIAFVGDALREQYDPIFTELYKAGVTHLAGPTGEAGYDMYAAALDLALNGPRKKYLSHVMSGREYARKAASDIACEEVASGEERIHKMVSVCVFQCADRNGSTHLAISIASSLRAIGYRTALVLPERHFIELKECFPTATSPLPDGGYNYFGIGIYAGDTANVPNAIDYDYIVLDQGTVSWFKTKNRTSTQQSEYREFNQANIAVWSSFMTPTGQWSLTVADKDGVRPLNDFVAKSTLSKIRFAVFGVDDSEIALAQAKVSSIAKRDVALVGIEPFVNPFLTIRGSQKRIPESVAKLLKSGIIGADTAKKLDKYIKAQKELDAETVRAGEPAKEAEKPQAFAKRFFGNWGRSR